MTCRSLLVTPLALLAAAALAAGPGGPADTLPGTLPHDEVPLGLGPRPAAADNPITAARVALGRRLFFDPILSADNTVACATCHRPEHGFAGPEARPRGVGGREGTRNAPTLFNRAYGKAFFWDGRATSLEEQALGPIANPAELASSVAEAVGRLRADAGYRARFAAAFDDGVTAANLARALASFERVLLRGDRPVDRFRQRGDAGALTPAERHGLWLYESKGQCWRCHAGPNFTDEGFHNTGVSWGRSPADLGRHRVTKSEADRGRFKTPTLRGVGLTAPYMHDGSLKSLDDVLDFYDRGGGANPNLDPAMRPLGLTREERLALAAFLRSL